MIKLKRLELQGFRKFKNQQVIDFPESGLLLIDGDSGVGKSTIFQAIAYALDICPFPSTALKSWTGEPLQVNLSLLIDGTEIRICRGKKTCVETPNGVKTGAKAVQEYVDSVFRLKPYLLSALTYRPQDCLGLFLSKDDSERKEFLGQILGLEVIEKALDDSEAIRKKLQTDLSFLQGQLLEKELRQKQVQAEFEEMSPEPVDNGAENRLVECSKVVLTLESEIAQIEQKGKELLSRIEQKEADSKAVKSEKLNYAKRLYTDLKLKNDGLRKGLDTKRDTVKTQIVQINGEINQIPRVQKDLATVQLKIAALKSNTCYVCHQPFTAELEIDIACEEETALKQKIGALGALEARKADLNKVLEGVGSFEDANEGKLLRAISTLEAELKVSSRTSDPEFLAVQTQKESLGKNLQRAKQEKFEVERDLKEYKAALELRAKNQNRRQEALDLAVAGFADVKAKVGAIETEIALEKDFAAVLGREGFLGVIFDEILSEISAETNSMLSELPNASHASIEFRSENNKNKKTIVPVIHIDGFETTRQAGLSGGQGASVDLAVDLAISKVIERRLGVSPGWVCLDETFNGMPSATKEGAMQLLRNASYDKLVIVIDHGSETKEIFTSTLSVKLDDLGNAVV